MYHEDDNETSRQHETAKLPVTALAMGLSPQMSLSPHRETYWLRIRWIVRNFQILMVSAVKTSKQCLQTASAKTLSTRPLPGLCPSTSLGDSVPQTPGI